MPIWFCATDWYSILPASEHSYAAAALVRTLKLPPSMPLHTAASETDIRDYRRRQPGPHNKFLAALIQVSRADVPVTGAERDLFGLVGHHARRILAAAVAVDLLKGWSRRAHDRHLQRERQVGLGSENRRSALHRNS